MKTHFSRFFSGLTIWLILALGGPLAMAQGLSPARQVPLDVASLRRQLTSPTDAGARRGPDGAYHVSLPTLRGPRVFALIETHVLPASDAAARQRLRTFVGYDEQTPTHRVSLVLTPRQLTAQLLAGTESASLRPALGGTSYLLEQTTSTMEPCGTQGANGGLLLRPSSFSTMPAPFSFGTQLRRIRYAILVTQEFYTSNGNTDATVEQAVVAAMNQMSGLYLQDLAVSYELVKPTGGSFYFSAMTTATLPGSGAATSGRLREQNLEDVNTLINARFATSTFDLGHCFHNGGGGVARLRAICSSGKARAWSGVRTSGFQGVLAHEMGHQHGADHTFTGPCGSLGVGSNLEPGGGATIMAYTDVCNVQTLEDVPNTEADHFNVCSLNQMRLHLQAVACPTATANTNLPPTLSAGADYVIPRNTPFTLTATGSDPNGETLFYTWNQFDYTTNVNALGTIAGINGLAAIDDPEAPLFRPRPPRTTPSRTFPDLRYVLANSNRPPDLIGEALSNVGRDLHFVVTARDRRSTGGTFTTDNVTLTVAPGTGPFAITTQNADPALWIAGQSATITWSVNGTDQAPIGVSQVRISLSTDGGQNFGTVLAASAPNTGSATVSIPNVTTRQARIRVEAVGNIFFDINDADFPIGPCSPVASQTLPATALTAPAGDAALNLSQREYSLTEYVGANQITGTISATDPVSFLSDLNGGSCSGFNGNATYYDTHVFVPSATGTYTIDAPGRFSGMVLRVYAGTNFVASRPCQNMLVDNFNAGSLSRSVTVALTAGQLYTLVVSNFNGVPAASSNYSISFATSPAGGTAYAPLQSLGYEYQYTVVNTATNKVVQISPTADLRPLPPGTYDVHGFLFQRNYSVSSLQNSLLGNLQTALTSLAPCGRLSSNTRRVTVTGTPLPVVLTSFSARPAATSNELRWQTALEQQVAYFKVQRAIDAQHFTDISQVAATNSNSSHDYFFLDTNPPSGPTYYRLLIQDEDGQVSYSPVVMLQSRGLDELALRVMAYPNPVPSNTALQLQFQARDAQQATLVVTDVVGRTVLHRTVAVDAGSTLLALPEARQWHGLHVLMVQTATGQRQQQKVVLQ
ncbi:zinc-dependent metalloprotease [Hymenobacter terrenus]|uniref:zinc-dependent metalloprotease n=1 Tax=Hymenobacter terrenus TaxID=1629124 RepID=UPI0006961118|nr:zinc-dependent metalloprotease [Hymenobacter terrenus]